MSWRNARQVVSTKTICNYLIDKLSTRALLTPDFFRWDGIASTSVCYLTKGRTTVNSTAL